MHEGAIRSGDSTASNTEFMHTFIKPETITLTTEGNALSNRSFKANVLLTGESIKPIEFYTDEGSNVTALQF